MSYQSPPGPNRIDPTPVRLSTNLSVPRQTPKTDFGERVKAGINQAAGAVANGAAIAAPLVPGGAIVSAAVSSVGTMSNGISSGQSSTLASYGGGNGLVGASGMGGGYGGGGIVNQYANAAGITPVPSDTTTGGGIGSGVPTTGGTVGGLPTTGSGYTGTNVTPVSSAAPETLASSQLSSSIDDQYRLLNLQLTMQHEVQVFQTVSNVLKVRHDTVKNTIANVR